MATGPRVRRRHSTLKTRPEQFSIMILSAVQPEPLPIEATALAVLATGLAVVALWIAFLAR